MPGMTLPKYTEVAGKALMGIAITGGLFDVTAITTTTRPHAPAWPLAVCAALFVTGLALWFLRDQHGSQPTSFDGQIMPIYPGRKFTNMTPSGMLKVRRDNTAIQAAKILEPYIGQWLRIRGPVDDVSPWITWTVGGESRVTFSNMRFMHDNKYVIMIFNNEEVVENRLAAIPRGTCMTVIGKISEISALAVTIVECEIESIG
jgi:hypothetical protein